MTDRPRALTGIKPTGMPHLGNYLGMIRPALELADRYDAFYFIADYHALTTGRDPDALRRHTLEVTATWLALGLDPERTVLFRQSDVPEVCELTWLLGCVTPLGLLQRAHAFKDAQAKGREISAGTFFYPVLMAADILLYGSKVVPVGKDQKQHVEMARDMAIAFNHYYGDVLTVPEPVISDTVATIPGLDGRKMSKSYANTIPLFLSPRATRKMLMRIVTDSTPVEQPKDPDSCTVFNLFRLMATEEEALELAARYRAGGFGYGHAKQALFDVMERVFDGPRRSFHQLMERPEEIFRILDHGGKQARKVAQATVAAARHGVGM